jgi:hypothetical protein
MSFLQIILIIILVPVMLWGYTLMFLHGMCMIQVVRMNETQMVKTRWYYDGGWIRNGFSISKTYQLLKDYRSNI